MDTHEWMMMNDGEKGDFISPFCEHNITEETIYSYTTSHWEIAYPSGEERLTLDKTVVGAYQRN